MNGMHAAMVDLQWCSLSCQPNILDIATTCAAAFSAVQIGDSVSLATAFDAEGRHNVDMRGAVRRDANRERPIPNAERRGPVAVRSKFDALSPSGRDNA
jgi:hypothetical protein